MSKLLELVKQLGREARLCAEYEKDPKTVMRRAGLSGEECKAMLDCDLEALRKLVGTENELYADNGTIKSYDE